MENAQVPNSEPNPPQINSSKPKRDTKIYGKRYTLTQKLAVKALLESGRTPTEIQRSENVDRSTVYNVMQDKRIELLAQGQVDRIKASLVGMTYGNAYRAQQAITDEKLSNSNALQLTTISAINIEKGRLMENLSTENVSFRGVATSIDEDRQKLMKRLDDLEGK